MIVNRTDISADAALSIVRNAIDYARANGWEMAAVVCEPKGNVVALWRSDNAIIPAVEIATDKAYTAASFRRSTEVFHDVMTSSPSLKAGLANRPRLMLWAGGFPIFYEGQCVGGIGVSGAADHQDAACARHAVETAGFTVEA